MARRLIKRGLLVKGCHNMAENHKEAKRFDAVCGRAYRHGYYCVPWWAVLIFGIVLAAAVHFMYPCTSCYGEGGEVEWRQGFGWYDLLTCQAWVAKCASLHVECVPTSAFASKASHDPDSVSIFLGRWMQQSCLIICDDVIVYPPKDASSLIHSEAYHEALVGVHIPRKTCYVYHDFRLLVVFPILSWAHHIDLSSTEKLDNLYLNYYQGRRVVM